MMKKKVFILMLALTLLLSAFPASVQAAADDIGYKNAKLGFSLTIPGDWAGKYRVMDFSVAAEFINSRNEEAGFGGFLFSIMVSENMEPLDWNGFRLLGQSGGLNYFGGLPSDVQFNHDNKSLEDEYNAMMNDIEAIFKSFRTDAETPADDDDLSIYIDGVRVASDVTPFIDSNGRTMVPVKFISEALGANVGWNSATRLVTITKDQTVIKLTIDSSQIIVNDLTKTMDTAAIITDGRTFVPVKYISEALGLNVGWDPATRTVVLTSTGTAASNSTPVGVSETDTKLTGLWEYTKDEPETYLYSYSFKDDGSFLYHEQEYRVITDVRGNYTASSGKVYLSNLVDDSETKWNDCLYEYSFGNDGEGEFLLMPLLMMDGTSSDKMVFRQSNG